MNLTEHTIHTIKSIVHPTKKCGVCYCLEQIFA